MTTFRTAPSAVSTSQPTSPPNALPTDSGRLVALAGLVSGAALVVDTVTIALLNSSFGVADDVLFLLGFAGLWVTLVGLAVHLSAGRRGAARLGAAVGTFLIAVLVIGGLAWAMDLMGHHVFSEANVGLHGEWSFFTVGVCLLATAGWVRRRG
jgi:heme/copper-type cytochrome/quinol oxidase subunit 4